MIDVLFIALAAVVGIIVGAAWHAAIVKEAFASKAELAQWALSLRAAFDADVVTAKNTLKGVIADIEKKLG